MEKRMIMTQDEKMAQNILGTDGINFHMGENKIEDIFEKEKVNKLNNQIDDYAERLQTHVDGLKETADKLGDISNVEIKPMFNRLLITPFKQNPFQRIKIESGIVTDLGGMSPDFTNPDTGKVEQLEQMIITGVVQEVGPEVKYIQPGDVVMYRKETAMPVPFFKQGFYCLAETQIITVVNEGLENRFNEIKNGK